MGERDVVQAFLSQEPAESSPLATDGARLRMNAEVVAEWCDEGLVVAPEKQGQLQEQLKDQLVHAVLLRMASQQPAHIARRMMAAAGA